MGTAIILTLFYIIVVWLIFFKFKWLRFNIAWGVISFWVGAHLLLIFLVGMRFFAPWTIDAHLIRNTIQIVPRLEGPTVLTEVLVSANQPVKKGDVLYRFDSTIYEQKVAEAEAQLAAAEQNVKILNANVQAAQSQLDEAKSQLAYAQTQQKRFTGLAASGGAREEEVDKWNSQVDIDTSKVATATANLEKAQLSLNSNIDGVNTSVAEAKAQLAQAQYYLGQTTVTAPADGFIVNQQAQPGLVVGDIRAGAIAAFVTDDPPYMLGAFFQEHIKFVEPGQTVEIALDIAPGEIYTGTVDAIWWATGQGQLVPSGRIPNFVLPQLQGKFAIEVSFDDPSAFLPSGTHGAIAIYTGRNSGFELMRKINIRLYSWANLIFPLDL